MKVEFNLNRVSEKVLLVIAFIILIIYYLPYFILGENANILIHDNLDSNVLWAKIVLENNVILENPQTLVPTIFNGLPVSSIYPYYNIPLLLFKLFGTYWGYVISKLFVSIIALLGMFSLLKKHFLPTNYSPLVLVTVSLIYSILPFWFFDASVMGLPFVLFAFLNIRSGDYRFFNWIIIFVFGFYSSMILSGLFLLIVLGILLIIDFISKRKINWMFILSLFSLVVVYLISHYPVISSFIHGEISHRNEFYRQSIDMNASFHKGWTMFVEGQYHAHSLHSYIFYPIIILILIQKGISKKVKYILVFILLTSILYGITEYDIVKPLFDHLSSIIPLQLHRFHFLHPMLWYILFAITISTLILKNKIGKIIVSFILLGQLIYVFSSHEIIQNRNEPTFKEFYSESTFSKIKETINKPIESYRVISVGMHPSIAQYNGFYTLDGYFPSYPLAYKHKFRQIIENEIIRDEKLRIYFDNWGSRCYAFSSELGLDFINNKSNSIDSLNYNFNAFKELGGQYIFSATPINLNINKDLQFIKSMTEKEDYWKIHVYKVKLSND